MLMKLVRAMFTYTCSAAIEVNICYIEVILMEKSRKESYAYQGHQVKQLVNYKLW